VDTSGATVTTGELATMSYNGVYYFYYDNWGCCEDNNCQSPCVYANNHTVLLYSTSDFVSWANKGVVLPVSARQTGILFRPHVIYNSDSKMFVMWYENRPTTSQRNYAVATSSSPEGPFVTTLTTTTFKCGLGGDFSLFVDDDKTAYLVVTHYSSLCVEKLDSTYSKGIGEMTTLKPPADSEAPVIFKRNKLYYVLTGRSCCACTGGANAWVFTSSSPLGPYTLQNDIGTAANGSFITRAQQSSILEVPDETGLLQYIWLGNQWGTAPDHCYNHDLVSWFPLQFETNGTINTLKWTDTITFTIQ